MLMLLLLFLSATLYAHVAAVEKPAASDVFSRFFEIASDQATRRAPIDVAQLAAIQAVSEIDATNADVDEPFPTTSSDCSFMANYFPPANGACHVLSGPNVLFGAAGQLFGRLSDATSYADGVSSIRRQGIPSARVVSNVVHRTRAVDGSVRQNPFGTTQSFLYFSEFVGNDLSRFGELSRERIDIAVPTGDDALDPEAHGYHRMPFYRSSPAHDNDDKDVGVRRFENTQSAWLDLSQLYGSDVEAQATIRSSKGGLLASQFIDGNELPMLADDGASFLCGDERCNDNLMMVAFTTVFLREHNRIARSLAVLRPDLDDEVLFEEARLQNIRQYQQVVYAEWLPLLLGEEGMSRFVGDYKGYDAVNEEDPTIMESFASAAFLFRLGGLNGDLRFVDRDGGPVQVTRDTSVTGLLNVAQIMSRPDLVLHSKGYVLDFALNGAHVDQHRELGVTVVDALRNRLDDVVAFSVQRGRDHGLPALDYVRDVFALPAYSCGVLHERPHCLQDFTGGDNELAAHLQSLYDEFDDIDAFTAGLAERRLVNSQLGETWSAIIGKQFKHLRDADRFFYLADQRSPAEVKMQDLIAGNFARIQRDVSSAFTN